VRTGWTDAVELRAGDMMLLLNGELVVVEQVQHEILESPVTVYNFEVEDFHTYYVSEISVLVHNMCGKPNVAELSDDALRNFGQPGKNQGFRVKNGTHNDAMSFARSQTTSLTELSTKPGVFSGFNTRGAQFVVRSSPINNYTSIRIYGVQGLKGIKFLWP